MRQTARQKEQNLAHPPLVLSLKETARQAREKEDWSSVGRAAVTMMKTPQRHVALIVLRKGAVLARHRAKGAVLLHVLSGKVRLGVGDARVDVGRDHLVTLDPLVPHDVEALAETEMLLFVAKEPAASSA